MTQVLDYSTARPTLSEIVAAKYVGVLRYLAPAIDAPKVIYQPEYDALRAAGLQIALNWEWYATRPREGTAAGIADAQQAKQQSDALGYTGAIYFSVDYDAPETDQANINAYFEAAAAVIGKARLGAYGGYWPLSRLFDANLISFGWQTLAWSGMNRETRASIYQTGAQALGACDVNDVLKPNWAGGSMVPTGWTLSTDGKVLTAANGVALDTGFLFWVEQHAPWDASNVPLGAPYEADPVSAQHPDQGNGLRLDFAQCSVGFSHASQTLFGIDLGKEYAALKAAPPPAPTPSDADNLVAAIKKVFPNL